MKEYPHITNQITNEYIYAFDKMDGSNIRAEWVKGKEFCKFGSRDTLISDNFPILKQSIPILKEKYEEKLHNIFVKNRVLKAVCFFEFYGPSSEFGNHKEDEEHDVILFDISIQTGLLHPRDFLSWSKYLHIPNLVFQGRITAKIIEEIKNRELKGITFEGTVCKGPMIKPGNPLMFKIKTYDWLAKLKEHCQGNKKLFKKLE